jgi:HK97 family phage major capsid protein
MRDLRSLPTYRPDAPGAVLDDHEWAESWKAYLGALSDPRSGARQVIANAWSERVPGEGGFLVPEQLRAQVAAYVTPAVVRPRAMVLPMGSLRLGLPLLDNPSQASSAGVMGGLTFSFTEEGAAIPSSTPALGRLALEARKLAALFTAPNELTADAAGAMGDFLSRVIALGVAWTEDDYFIGTAGTGAGCPQSIINAGCAKLVTRTNSGDAPVLADIAAMVSALHAAALAAGLTPGITDVGWLMSTSVFTGLLELYYNVGGSTAPTDITPVAVPDWLSLGDGHEVGPSMMGLPMFVNDHQPAAGTQGDLALADIRNYVIGDRLALTVESAAKGSGFITDVSQFRVKTRVDGRYWIQTSTTTEASQSASPVVVLK